MDKPVLLEVKDLKTYFYSGKHALKAVDSVSFSIREGEVFGLVGESGSGKSITCKSLIGLIHRPGRIAGGSIRYRGQELVGLSEKALTAVRGKEIGMIFQEPMVALNPVLRIGQQITESFKDPGLSGEEKHARAVELLRRVGIPNPEQRMREYPHQFSGGMRQRLLLAQAILADPEVLVLDEPTAGLDPQQRIAVRNLIAEIALHRIVLLSTHVVQDVEYAAKELILLSDGAVLRQASAQTLLREMQGQVWEVPARGEAEIAHLRTLGQFCGIVPSGEGLFVRLLAPAQPTPDSRPARPELEDVYLACFGEEGRL